MPLTQKELLQLAFDGLVVKEQEIKQYKAQVATLYKEEVEKEQAALNAQAKKADNETNATSETTETNDENVSEK